MGFDFLKYFDGTDKTPRDVQKQALEWIQDSLLTNDILCIQAPVASGKSAITRAVQLVTKAPIITPSNILIDQYTKDYPKVNALKGKSHYSCGDGFTCQDKVDVLEEEYCPDCPYVQAKMDAIEGAPTFFNPLSMYYATISDGWRKPLVTIVDEAHLLAGMILLMAGKRFDDGKYDIGDVPTTANGVSNWLVVKQEQMKKLAAVHRANGHMKKVLEVEQERRTIYYILQGLREDPKNYAIFKEKQKVRGRYTTYLTIKPIRPPEFLTKRLLSSDKVILLSGTIFPGDVKDLLPSRKVAFLDLPSPIPKKNRPVILQSVNYKMNWKTPPAQIAQSIKEVLEKHPNENTIIHVSYAMSKTLAPLFPEAITNTSENKIKKVEEFKKKGGVFLAAGCAEGLDFKGDLCRVNIIPKLLYPNLKDPVVEARMALEGGDEWYNLETLKLLIQQAGRSTRCLDDYSTTYVLDPGAKWRIKKYSSHLPKSFLESLVVGK